MPVLILNFIFQVIDADWVASYWFAKYRGNREEINGRNENLNQCNEAKPDRMFGPSFVFSTLRNISRGLFRLLEMLCSLFSVTVLVG